MAEEFLRSIQRNEGALIPPDFNAEKARRELAGAYHPDLARNGKERKKNESKMKEINIAFDEGDIIFLYDELERLRISKVITKNQEQNLRNKVCSIEKVYESPEEFEEVLKKVRNGKYREAVDDVIAKAKEKGIFYTVIVPGSPKESSEVKMIPYNKSNVISKRDETKNHIAPENIAEIPINERLRDIQRMMDEINRLEKPNSDDGIIGENKKDQEKFREENKNIPIKHNPINEITNLNEDVRVVSFGREKNVSEKEPAEIPHRNLKEWSSFEVRNDPCSFIGDVLNNINLQLKRKRELKLPSQALGIVLQLLQREYSKLEYDNPEKNRSILEEARRNLLGDDVDKIINELKNAENLFRIDNIFKEYIKDNEIFSNEARENKSGNVFKDKSILNGREDSLRAIIEETRKKQEEIKKLIESQQSKIPTASVKGAEEIMQKKTFQNDGQKSDNKKTDVGKNGDVVLEIKKSVNPELFEKTKSDIIEKRNALDNIFLPDEGISKEDMADYFSSSNTEGNIGKTIPEKSGESINEKKLEEENSKVYLEMIRNLVDLDMKTEEIKRRRIKQEGISVRLRIKESKKSELENEYKKTQNNYRELREEFMKKSGLEEEKVDEKIISMRQELEQRKSKFNKEKAEEYIHHLKKIIEYQKDSLPEKKKIVFEKIITTIKDKRFQIVISALILGISITVPETGGASWLTNGLVSGFLPEELGLPLKYAGTAAGGYLFGDALKSILETRKFKIAEIEKKIVEKISNFVYPKVNTINDFTVDDSYVIRSATFFDKFQKLEVKNNFIKTKKQIRES
ncbi:MAG: hypothetical protein WC472_03220 [Candidatus Paceibacterota bacterium]